ncbi:MAG: 2-oxoacid:ferredoxin oxidoreductase subunit beta [Myxococcota bacterium]|jgi:2-oxoglutarate ferredoxin oxidoreductase subunit beta|nr:2-oxoacid:ferredoxin oxidoreductase subunit beta [Myxococcota bacterium]
MSEPIAKLSKKDFESDQEVRWCPGCGDYSVLANVQRVMPELGLPRENFVFVSGIGCSSRFPYYMNTYGFHTIHGRAPAFATGIKVARPELSVWVITGDGDGLSIGGNHMLHVIRRNVDLQILLFNNRIYGLTKGQYSPTSRLGMRNKSVPMGVIDAPIEPIAFALGAGATFVARTVDVDAPALQDVLRRAHEHKGTAFVEILQNCPVYNDGEWAAIEDKKTRVDAGLPLEHGQPLVFGSKGQRRGIRIEHGVPTVVPLRDDEDPVAAGITVHDEKHESPAYAFALATLAPPVFPIPTGVLRAVERPSYERLLEDQVTGAIAARGPGSLAKLLHSGDTWTVG